MILLTSEWLFLAARFQSWFSSCSIFQSSASSASALKFFLIVSNHSQATKRPVLLVHSVRTAAAAALWIRASSLRLPWSACLLICGCWDWARVFCISCMSVRAEQKGMDSTPFGSTSRYHVMNCVPSWLTFVRCAMNAAPLYLSPNMAKKRKSEESGPTGAKKGRATTRRSRISGRRAWRSTPWALFGTRIVLEQGLRAECNCLGPRSSAD